MTTGNEKGTGMGGGGHDHAYKHKLYTQTIRKQKN